MRDVILYWQRLRFWTLDSGASSSGRWRIVSTSVLLVHGQLRRSSLCLELRLSLCLPVCVRLSVSASVCLCVCVFCGYLVSDAGPAHVSNSSTLRAALQGAEPTQVWTYSSRSEQPTYDLISSVLAVLAGLFVSSRDRRLSFSDWNSY